MFPTKKTNLTYPDGLVAIGSYAFDGNEADIIVVPWGVTSILECGLRSKGQVKVVPDTVTRFDLPSSYRDPAGVYLWAGENDVIEKAAEVYSLDGQKDQFEALSTYWQTFGYRRISDVCNGTKAKRSQGGIPSADILSTSCPTASRRPNGSRSAAAGIILTEPVRCRPGC